MATHVHGGVPPTPRRHPARSRAGLVVTAVLAGLCATLLIAPPAANAAAPATGGDRAAAPTTPATAEEAKQAWIDGARRAETWGERVLDAEQAVTKARTKAQAAGAALKKRDAEVAAAQRTVDEAQKKVDAADVVVQRYQARIDKFTNASFRGARLSDVSLLLTADSPDDYLDAATSLDRVAAETQATLRGAETAKKTAEAARGITETARVKAAAARKTAAQAKAAADASASAAVKARKDLDSGRKKLDEEIAGYQVAYARLSVGDRSAAVSDLESANMSAAALARQADQAAQREAAGLTPDYSIDYSSALGAAQAARGAPSVQAGIAVEAALSRQGLPYVWAATGPDAFDCSGLMVWAWAQAGVTIPRTSADQAGLPEVPLDELKPGDLVTFYSPVSHVGMYVGNGMVLHASMPGVPIKVVPLDASGPNPTGHRVNA